MLTTWLMTKLEEKFLEYTSREERQDVLTIDAFNANGTTVTLTSLPALAESAFLYNVIEFGTPRIARVVNYVDADTLTLGWRAPLPAEYQTVDEVTLYSGPMAGAAYYTSGASKKQRVIEVTAMQVDEDPFGLGRGFGAFKECVKGIATVMIEFPTSGDPSPTAQKDRETQLYYLFEQVREVLREGAGVPQCRRFMLPTAKLSRWRQQNQWYYHGETVWMYETEI